MPASSELMPPDHYDLRCRQIIMILDAARPLWSPMLIAWSIDEQSPVLQQSIYRLTVKLMITTIPLHNRDRRDIDRHRPTTITIYGAIISTSPPCTDTPIFTQRRQLAFFSLHNSTGFTYCWIPCIFGLKIHRSSHG
jgi:hypothetical protein